MDVQSDLYPLYVVSMEEFMNNSELQTEYSNCISDVYEKDNRDS